MRGNFAMVALLLAGCASSYEEPWPVLTDQPPEDTAQQDAAVRVDTEDTAAPGNPDNGPDTEPNPDTQYVAACYVDPALCDDGNGCTNDSCDPLLGCTNTPNNLPCGDDPCVDQACAKGGCVTVGGCADGDACTMDLCDPGIGCVFVQKPGCVACKSPDDCNDSDNCTNHVCLGGKCLFGPVACSDNDPCTADTCDPATGCSHEKLDCTDGQVCHDSECDPKAGVCKAVPVTSGVCADGDACTLTNECQFGVCVPTAVKGCDDGDPCTADKCSSVTGACTYTPIIGCGGNCAKSTDCPANDSNPCDADVCIDGKCSTKTAPEGEACLIPGTDPQCTIAHCQAGKCTADPAPCTKKIDKVCGFVKLAASCLPSGVCGVTEEAVKKNAVPYTTSYYSPTSQPKLWAVHIGTYGCDYMVTCYHTVLPSNCLMYDK